MFQDTRLLLVQSDEELGQFLDTSVEAFIGGSDTDVRVSEIDPNEYDIDLENL